MRLLAAGRLPAAFFLHAAEGKEGFVVKGGEGVFAYHPFGARGIVCAEHKDSFLAQYERVKFYFVVTSNCNSAITYNRQLFREFYKVLTLIVLKRPVMSIFSAK